ncbi:hypothetical protein [Paenibacillus sp. MY03]|uniref:hypothetical protein n=1 Tax=Paenibacillus sp. MY03 TaxID=302980 RepID=UPI0015C5D518|nr:hypothetical protein [Paenibacillus sp. MY03]
MMRMKKSLTASMLAAALLGTSLTGLPSGMGGLSGGPEYASAAGDSGAKLPSRVFLERMNELHKALAEGDPVDVQDVRNLRDEIAALDVDANLKLLDPVWNKISTKLPDHVDEPELKRTLFRIVKSVGSFRYDPEASDLEEIRTNPEYRAALKTIAAAGGNPDIVMDDFLVFLFGDGAGRKGVEGTIASELAVMSSLELLGLLGSNEGITNVLLQATDKLLAKKGDYAFVDILSGLGVTAKDIRSLVLNFQVKLQKDVPAIRAMTVAYLRTASEAVAAVSEDGREHRYSLRVAGVAVPQIALVWSKVSGDSIVTVSSKGVVSIPSSAQKASAVIRASLQNPYGGSPKVIFEQEVTLKAVGDGEEGEVFPVEAFLERMNKLRDALLAGDPADVDAVRSFRDEWTKLSFSKDGKLLDPLWKRVKPNLPKTVDEAKLKRDLFDILVAVGSFRYDPKASDLEEIRSNPEFRAALKTLAAAGGVSNVTMDDFLILLFGDGKERGGLEGEMLESVSKMKPSELALLLRNKNKLSALVADSLAGIMEEEEEYPLAKALADLGVRPIDMRQTAKSFQSKFKHDEEAALAMAIAYIRSEAEVAVKVTDYGRQHQYSLSFQGIELPDHALQWSKVSGDKEVSVSSNGRVTIPKGTASATALIQAAVSNPSGKGGKVVFQQEVTLVNEQEEDQTAQKIAALLQALDGKLAKIEVRLASSKTDIQKVSLLLDTAREGNHAARELLKLNAGAQQKEEALAQIKTKVNATITKIIKSLLEF